MREIEEGICIWVEGREERQNSECRMQNSEMEAGGLGWAMQNEKQDGGTAAGSGPDWRHFKANL
jgi:hypothetical protein